MIIEKKVGSAVYKTIYIVYKTINVDLPYKALVHSLNINIYCPIGSFVCLFFLRKM